jgi:hypothetical protein
MTTWQPLTDRLATLPLLLAGPIVRWVGPDAVTVWVALREPRLVTLRIYTREASGELTPRLEGTRQTVRFGVGLHIVAVTARTTNAAQALPWGTLCYYDLFFATTSGPDGHAGLSEPHLGTPGVLNLHPEACSPLQRLVYEGHPLPAFVLPPPEISQLRIFHGSCRRPTGEGYDMLAALDQFLEAKADDPVRRPQYLFFTGDQVYGEGVALPLLYALMDAAATLIERDLQESLPLINQGAAALGPGLRKEVVRELARFTTPDPKCHLLSRAEYAMMYLFSWSDVLWPRAFATLEEIRAHYPQEHPLSSAPWQHEAELYSQHLQCLEEFRATLPQVRRVLANIPTYMICDDHDVTDDWYLDGAWCRRVLASPLGRRIIRNALLTYALFQGWGNDPAQFAGPNGVRFLKAVDTWQGNEEASQAQVIEEALGIPTAFTGTGELPRSPQALHWHYALAGPGYRIMVLDTRTRRIYGRPSSPPGLLSPQAMAEQLVDYDPNLTIVISATPILGLSMTEHMQSINPLHRDNYAYDREAWSLDRSTYHQLLKTVRCMGRVVVLSGDVHYGFGAILESWEQTGGAPATSVLVDFTSSSLRNEAEGLNKVLLSVFYPRYVQWLGQYGFPPIEEFVWEGSRAFTVFHRAMRAVSSHWWRLFWAVARWLVLRHPGALLVLPASGWPPGTFDAAPPDVRTRLRYLRAFHPAAGGRHEDRSGQEGAVNGKHERSASAEAMAAERRDYANVSRTDGPETPQPTLHHLRLVLQGSREHPPALEHRLAGYRTAQLMEQAKRQNRSTYQTPSNDYLITTTNLGEICFDWERKEAMQCLWYPAVGSDEHISIEMAIYRASLESPPADAAPRLP